MNKKLIFLVSILIISLLGLMFMLIHWGNKSIELREDLFVDQVNIGVDEMITDLEENYYCFELTYNANLPQLDSFYITDIPGVENGSNDKIDLTYISPSGEINTFKRMPLMGPAQMYMSMRFEFDDIPKIKEDSSLTRFEKWVRESYKSYVSDINGTRLFDTIQFDSLVHFSVQQFYPEAEIAYVVKSKDNGNIVFTQGLKGLNEKGEYDVYATIFDQDENIPDLELNLLVLNKKDMFKSQAWNIYASAALLTLISIILIGYLIRLQIQQKRVLNIQKDFVHGITHEFNTPLANIKLVSKNLNSSTDPKTKKAGLILEEESGKLQTGINLVLTTALIEKDELLLQKDYLDIATLIEKICKKNMAFLEESGIDLDMNLETGNMNSLGDAFHLENVFQNLINNVQKHSQASLLKVNSERNNGTINILFSDNGKGIEVEKRKKVFEKFERRVSKNSNNGYGLGLYYSKMILQLHGGDISLIESKESGSAFSIQLPA